MYLETIYIHISLTDYSFLLKESLTHISTETANTDVHEYLWNFVKIQVVFQNIRVEGLRVCIFNGFSGSERQVIVSWEVWML